MRMGTRRVMTSCPNTREVVATGVEMHEHDFAGLSDEALFSFRCVACTELHTWQKQEAWLEWRSDGR